jgi:hypothetical protein
VLIGTVFGLVQLADERNKVLKRSHHEWGTAKHQENARMAFLWFFLAAPIVLIAPAAMVAIHREPKVEQPWAFYVVIGVTSIAAFTGWCRRARVLRMESMSGADPIPSKKKRLRRLYSPWAWMAGGGIFWALLAGWLAYESESPKYAALVGAWLVAVMVTALVPYLRGRIRLLYERDETRVARAVALSCLSSALLAVPALAALAAALPLPGAVACGEGNYLTEGRFVGETKDRVYIGDDKRGRIVDLPTRKVDRVYIGDGGRERCG